jgi:hypothetical protein
MPDYSDEEIDKASDEASDTEDVLIDGKPAKNKAKGFGDDKDVREL